MPRTNEKTLDYLTRYPGTIGRLLSVPEGLDVSRYRKAQPDIDKKGMAFEAIVASEERVVIWDRLRGQLVEEILVAGGGEFPSKVPLLDSHQMREIGNVVGAISGFRREGPRWVGRGELTPGVQIAEDAFKRIAAGHLTDVSVGYVQLKATIIAPGDSAKIGHGLYRAGKDYPLMVTTEWLVHEVSLCAIGADAEAKIRGIRQLQEVTDLRPRRQLRRHVATTHPQSVTMPRPRRRFV